jgi:hypothetical protein
MVLMYHRQAEQPQPWTITIRLSRPTDVDELRRVAERDSRPVPAGEMLIAIVEGEIRAAISLSGGEAIADPFHPTEELVRMLALRRSEVQAEAPRPRRRLRRLRLASG